MPSELNLVGAVLILSAVFLLIRAIRGPLPPKPPEKTGGQVTEEEGTGPKNEA